MTIQLKPMPRPQTQSSIAQSAVAIRLADDLAKLLTAVCRIPQLDKGDAIENLERLNAVLSEAHGLLFKVAADFQIFGRMEGVGN